MKLIDKSPLWLKILIFGVLYFLLMVVGYEFYYSSDNVAMFWPASGLLLSILLLSKPRNWVWYILTVLVCQVWVDMIFYSRVWYLGITFGLANSLESLVGAVFIRRFFKTSMDAFTFRFLFATVVVGAFFSPIFSATAGTFIVIFAYGADISTYWSIWQVWWSADFLGILIILPTILAWQSVPPEQYSTITNRKKLFELIALIASLFIVVHHVFGATFTGVDEYFDLPYIIIPFLLWATFSFSPRTVTAIMTGFVFLAVWYTDQGRGILVFLSHTPNEVIVSLQSFLSIIAISLLYLIVLVNELRKSRNNLAELNLELEKRVQLRTKQLSDINKELDAFSYSVSHDLQAPIRAIVGFSEILESEYMEYLPEQAVEYLDRIEAASKKMHEQIKSLLTLSRIGRKELNFQPVNITELVQQIYSDLQMIAPELMTNIDFQVMDCGMVVADPHILEAAIQNLLSNAIKFTDPNRKPEIKFGYHDNEQGRVFYLQDNGVGFEMEYAKKIFEPFQRLHSEKEFAGSGIGLSIVQSVIRRHHGEIWAESEIGKGTTFYFTLSPNLTEGDGV